MKIMQINCVYATGSTGKIVYDIHSSLKEKGYESIVCYGRGNRIKEKGIYKTALEFNSKARNIISRFTGRPYGGAFFSTQRLIAIVKKEQPSVVHLHCINGFFVNIYKLIEFLKKSNIRTVITLHAEFMHTGNCSYAYDCEKWLIGCGDCPRLRWATNSLFLDRTNANWKVMQNAFKGFDDAIVVSVSPWLMDRARRSPILSKNKHFTVLNGIDTNVFDNGETQDLKNRLALKDEKILLHVTPCFTNEIKGGKYILALADLVKNDNIKIVVVGNTDKSIKLPANIIDVGRVENQEELSKYYSMADLTVLTSKRETFSMICAESLCCGTPIIGFKAGAPEIISLPEFSEFVGYADVDALLKAIRHWLNNTSVSTKDISERARAVYGKEKMVAKYMGIYKEVLRK